MAPERISRRAWVSLFACLLLLGRVTAGAQTPEAIVSGKPTIAHVPSPLSLEARPAFDIPLGESSQWFTFGGSMDLGVNYRIPGSIFYLSGGIQYAYAPVQAAASLSILAAKAGGGIQVPLTSAIGVFAYALGGYYFGSYNDFTRSASDPLLACGLGLKFALAPTFALQVGAQYKYYAGLYAGLSAGAGVDVALGNLGGSVEIPTIDLHPAFPVFYKHYDDHPIGTVRIKSNLKVPASEIRAQVFMNEYMDSPKVVEVSGVLAPGESRDIDLYALFNDKVLTVTEGTKVAAEITVAFKVDGQLYENRKTETLTLWGRNAMTWDDDRKAAAYVTSKDPGVLGFARSVSSYVRSRENRSICENLQAAIAFHQALDLYGLNYTPNPKTPYEKVSLQKDAIDFLQFPRETFQYKAGDCSDLSILYAALFQAIGIDAAFITVPGHIFIAVDTGLTPEQAPRELIPESQFIAYKNKAWIPVEVTAIHGGFMRAWQLGAKEWTENKATGQAGFYPIQEAWAVYQPVGLPGTEIAITVPPSDRVLRAYQGEVQRYLDAALAPTIAKLQEQIRSSGSPAAMNSLGVLYAKYGQADKAEQQFKLLLSKKPYLPALLNLGHLYFTQGDWRNALDSYRQAGEMDPRNPHTLLGLARVYQEMQNYAEAKQSYEKLKAVNPVLASQFAWLGEAKEGGTRAADISTQRKTVSWESEE
jgi:tetratricopeptide (TPR) repeat protein